MSRFLSTGLIVLILAVPAWASEPCEVPSEGQIGETQYRYVLSEAATALYPQTPAEGTEEASVFPDYYEQFYTDLEVTIEHFTDQSLSRGGLDADAEVDIVCDRAAITLSGSGDLDAFAGAHKSFLDAGAAGLAGAYACSQSSTPPSSSDCEAKYQRCWDPAPGDQPWAFMLPLGLPIVNQQAVLLLNYPPSDSLCGRDYLNNFTMARFGSVMQSVGVSESDVSLYETILDSRPIAAPGSGQADCMPDISTYFDDPPSQDYVGDMLGVLVASGDGSRTQPVFVLGGPAQETWQSLIGGSVETGDGGVATLTLGSQEASVPWVAANHPDVTSYNCCANDQSPSCQEMYDGETSTYLVPDELSDLQTYCAIVKVSNGADPKAALEECSELWCQNTYPDGDCPAATKKEICIRLRLDYSYDSPDSQCTCREAAEAFCEQYDDNGCPNDGKKTSCAEFNEMCSGDGPSWSECPS